MDIYESLAEELMEALDRKKRPPHEDMSAAMRGEMAVLRLLSEESRALTAGEISSLLSMTTSRIAAVLGALEKKGLILRSADARDKRRVLVTLTQQGLSFCRRKRQCMLETVSHTLSQIGERDAREFVRLMKRVYSLFPQQLSACGGEEEKKKEDIHER